VVISHNEVKLVLLLNMLQLQIIAIVDTPSSQLKTVISKMALLGGTEPNPGYLQTRINEFVIQQLNIEENVLFFKPNPAKQSELLRG
jgi:hypothetical protein